MAADLTGMFAQLNKAIKGFDGMAQPGIDMMSQGIGNAASAGAGLMGVEGVNSMSFMNEKAKSREGMQQLANIDMSTTQGMKEAAEVYRQMGEVAKAAEISKMLMVKQQADMEKLEKGQEEINQGVKDTRARRSAAASARAAGDDQAAEAIMAAQMTPADYYKVRFQNKVDTEKAVATQKPNAPKVVDLQVGNQAVKHLVYDNGTTRAIGKVPEGWQSTTETDPDTGTKYNVFVKPSTGEKHISGVAELPKMEVKGSATDGWTVFDAQGQRVRKFDNLTDAEKWQSNFKQVAQTGVTKNAITEAMRILGATDAEGNMIDPTTTTFNPDSGGWESLVFQYLPNNDERTLKGFIDTVKSNLSFEALTALEEPLTPVSNVEILLLGQRIAQLNPLDDPKVTAEKLYYINQNLTNIQKLALGEPAQNTINWEDPAYQGIVQTVRDESGALTVKLPDGTWIEVQ